MHNEETKTTSTPRRAMHGPGGRGGVTEKPKDFGNAIKRWFITYMTLYR